MRRFYRSFLSRLLFLLLSFRLIYLRDETPLTANADGTECYGNPGRAAHVGGTIKIETDELICDLFNFYYYLVI